MLKLENINITFNKNTANERKALQHIDLDVADGDFVTVIGSNGAGKSHTYERYQWQLRG